MQFALIATVAAISKVIATLRNVEMLITDSVAQKNEGISTMLFCKIYNQIFERNHQRSSLIQNQSQNMISCSLSRNFHRFVI
ncbi:unnamed protein product [Blepharisma stoltei]|uniref:Secreted protein n=1 Tax=Blepharisma stoltei TaxID=1481888 RepID=A0AAU9IVL8_9CILI|nr:unnamed protein product [Blepharisma stoltei]